MKEKGKGIPAKKEKPTVKEKAPAPKETLKGGTLQTRTAGPCSSPPGPDTRAGRV